MIKKKLLVIAIILAFTIPAFANEKKTVAVMDLSDQFRKEAEYVTRKLNGMLRDKFDEAKEFKVVSKDKLEDGLDKLSDEKGFEFELDTSLLDDEAQMLSEDIKADLYVMGNVTPVRGEEEKFKVNVSTLDVKTLERPTNVYYTNKDVDNIESVCDSIIESTKMMTTESLVKYLKYAREYYKVKQFKDAIKAFKKVLEFEPNHFESLQTLGFIYENQGEYDKAEEYYKKANKSKKKPTTYQHLAIIYKKQDRHEDAIEAYKQALELDPKQPSHIWVNIGMTYHQDLENYDKAIESYKKAIEIDSTYTYAITNLGFLYNYREEWDKAIPMFKQAIALNPEYIPSYEKLATAYEKKAKSYNAFGESGAKPDSVVNKDAAIKAYHHAIDVYKRIYEIQEDVSKLTKIGLMYDTIKEYENAIKWYEKYIEERPDELSYYCRLGFDYVTVGETDKAESLTDEMLEKDPNSACAYVIKGDIQSNKRFGGELEDLKAQKATYLKAIDHYKNAIEVAGDDEVWLSNYAEKQKNRLQKAIVKISEQIDKIIWGG